MGGMRRAAWWVMALGMVLALLPCVGRCDVALDRALTCRAAREPDVARLRAVLDLEAELGVPNHLRGLALAAACVESGYRDGARGDCAPGATGDGCAAWGWFQFHGWAARFIDRDDALASARLWLSRVVARLHHPWVERCRPVDEADRWRLAHVLAVRAPGKARCGAVPLAWRVMARWAREVEVAR